MVNLASITLDDRQSEEVRRSHHEALSELQSAPFVGAKVIASVKLVDGQATTVAHGLGRTPKWVGVSVPRGATAAGFIVETRGQGGVDANKAVILTASGYGATITIDVAVL